MIVNFKKIRGAMNRRAFNASRPPRLFKIIASGRFHYSFSIHTATAPQPRVTTVVMGHIQA